MHRIAILGAGRVGSAIARDLAKDAGTLVTVADRSAPALQALAEAGIATQLCDLADPAQIREAVDDADIVVGAVPGFMGYRTVEAVLRAGRNLVDISFFEEDPFTLDALARDQGLIAITDCGIAPGCGNLILGDLERDWQSIHSFECLVGGLPVVRSWPYEYKAGFSPVDVLEEYTRPARYVAHGQEVLLPALSEPELVEFPGVGTLEAFNTDGLRSLLTTVAAPFKKEKTLRYPGHIDKIRLLRDTGLFGREPVRIGDAWIAPMDLTAKLLLPLWQMELDEEDFTVMRIVVEGRRDGRALRRQYDLLDRYDRPTRTTSMARTTGYTCAAAVRLVLGGHFQQKGISPPEFVGRQTGCWPFIRAELAARGVRFTETETELPAKDGKPTRNEALMV